MLGMRWHIDSVHCTGGGFYRSARDPACPRRPRGSFLSERVETPSPALKRPKRQSRRGDWRRQLHRFGFRT
jgi:hypothetical protein